MGSPLMNQLTVGRGAPSVRHTRRPFSSGAKTKSVGFSSQKGAAVRHKHFSFLHIIVQSVTYLKVCLTFDPDGYCVLYVSKLIGGSAAVFTHIIKRGLWDLNHLVEVFYSRSWRHCQVVTILGPRNMRSWP